MVWRIRMKLKRLDGVSKVQGFNQITIVKDAREILGATKGDTIGFFEIEGTPGIVVIAKVSVVISSDFEVKVDD
ncbi:MAG: hypothetical protein SA339_08270 [Methanomassiliicoccus sp.]|nr:hypothetical protein [Methanomassiliicoccus sp.]